MSACLLRLLLCLCLLADTVAPALAATHLASAGLGQAAAVPAARERTGPAHDAGCHGIADADAGTPPPATPDRDEDCLERCLDLCRQHALATVAALVPPVCSGRAQPGGGAAQAQVDEAHAAPGLRPPIA